MDATDGSRSQDKSARFASSFLVCWPAGANKSLMIFERKVYVREGSRDKDLGIGGGENFGILKEYITEITNEEILQRRSRFVHL